MARAPCAILAADADQSFQNGYDQADEVHET
jgi:hypothetical protein